MRPQLPIAAAALALLLCSCRDPDVADDAVRPDNVGASVEECSLADGSPASTVEITNGTGHAASFEVTVRFFRDGERVGTGTARSETIAPGRRANVEVRSDATADDVDDCRIEDVEDLGA